LPNAGHSNKLAISSIDNPAYRNSYAALKLIYFQVLKHINFNMQGFDRNLPVVKYVQMKFQSHFQA